MVTATSHGLEEEELMMQPDICIHTDYQRGGEVEKWKERERERRDAGECEVVSAEAGDRYLVQGRGTAGVVTEERPLVQ